MASISQECVIQGSFLTCPFEQVIAVPPEEVNFFGDIQCPLDSVSQTGFVEATNIPGLCQCDASVADVGAPIEDSVDLDCECFACPAGTANIGFSCSKAVVGSCAAFDCEGVCTKLDTSNFAPLLSSPALLWASDVGADISVGNGIFITPDGAQVVVVASNGEVNSFDASNGDALWSYTPQNTVSSSSNMIFTTANSADPYMVYSIFEEDGDEDFTTQVIALEMDGSELWISEALPGVGSGSPAISDDGNYVFLTHNSASGFVGEFSILSAADDGGLFYTMKNETNPFSPPGIFHNPAEGYYDSPNALGNTNDILMWSVSVPPGATTIGDGATFAFQFPVGFAGATDGVEYTLLGDSPRNFQSNTAPVLTNSGRSAYISASRGLFVAWVGVEGLARFRFSRAPSASAGFTRNSMFPGQPVFASLALSSNSAEPILFGGTASTEFVRMDSTLDTVVVASTSSNILAEAVVDPIDRVVYYVESNGDIHQADFDTLQDMWTFSVASSVEGEMALSPDGSVLYVGTKEGSVGALQVADADAPTKEPTAKPTSSPSASPTTTPSAMPTKVASSSPTAIPTAEVTASPTVSPQPTKTPTKSPSRQPTGSPTKAPTEQPSPSPSETASGAPSPGPTITARPTTQPSESPTGAPTITASPTTPLPSPSPSDVPTEMPSPNPSEVPSKMPSAAPTLTASGMPSERPSEQPSSQPTVTASNSPTDPAEYYLVVSSIPDDKDWCLTATKLQENANLGFRPCDYDNMPDTQQWKFQNGKFKSKYDESRCIQSGFGTVVFRGIRVRLGTCQNGQTSFIYNSESRYIKPAANRNLCVTNRGSVADREDTIHLLDCTDRDDYYWDFVPVYNQE